MFDFLESSDTANLCISRSVLSRVFPFSAFDTNSIHQESPTLVFLKLSLGETVYTGLNPQIALTITYERISTQVLVRKLGPTPELHTDVADREAGTPGKCEHGARSQPVLSVQSAVGTQRGMNRTSQCR